MKAYHTLVVSHAKGLFGAASSAAAEWVFSLFKKAFGEEQKSSLHDLVAATLMVQYNKHELQ